MSGPANQIAVAAGEAMSVLNDYTREQIDIIKNNIAPPNMSDAHLAYCLTVAKSRNLDPFKKQVYFALRNKKVKDAWGKESYVAAVTVEPTIDGFRSMAEQTGELDGYEGPYWCGSDGVWADVWLSSKEPPVAAKIVVFRKGRNRGTTAVARYDAYKQDGPVWQKMGDSMLAKCAESLALRKAFPAELGEFYTHEEMAQADSPNRFGQLPQEQRAEVQQPAVVVNLPPPVVQQAPAVQQSPRVQAAPRQGAAPRQVTPPAPVQQVAAPAQLQAQPTYREKAPQERPVARQADGLPEAWTSSDPIPASIQLWCKPLAVCGERTIYQLTISELELVVEQAAIAYERAAASTKGTQRLLEILNSIGSAADLLLTQRLAEGAQ